MDGQVQVRNELGQVAVAFDDGVGEFAWVAGGEAQAFNTRDFVDDAQQGGKVADAAVVHFAAIGVDVLPQQVDFFHALLRQAGDFGEHVVQRARKFFAARVGHHAEAAIFGAAFHNGNKRAAAVHAGGGQVVKFFNFGEGDVHLRQPCGFFIHNHFGQAVQGLRAEDDIHIGCAFDNGFAFLRGNAAGHADDELGVFLFQRFHAPKVGKDFFLRFFAHGAGVEEDDVGVIGFGNLLDTAVFFGEDGEHFFAVVFVHLAAEGADKDFFHGLRFFQVARNCGADVGKCFQAASCVRQPENRKARIIRIFLRELKSSAGGWQMLGCSKTSATICRAPYRDGLCEIG